MALGSLLVFVVALLIGCYTLKPVRGEALPTIRWRCGLYRYMADAAVFADCFTSVTYPVVNNIVMENIYLQVRSAPGEAVLTFSAHFVIVPSMEEGMTVKSLVPSSAPFQIKA
ncbi:MAG: hypothetical protein ACSLEN_12710 [Candidatus Malihini olakiniferum]